MSRRQRSARPDARQGTGTPGTGTDARQGTGTPGTGTPGTGAGPWRSPPAGRAQPVPPADQPGLAPALILDALGKKCPIPIIMLAARIGEVPVGQTVEVLADDPAARTDLPAWCALKSQEFLRAAVLPAGWSFLVRRSY